ncbi:suppressor of loss of ypt1 [Saitozyma podzolica]|uniref:Suppressor of loss of ypt1 n=1 Tax=Saitozyma podzolica TaxID=1890683 RepID=A0A427YWE1_9TREE|nr:suppressor of loss of ypt1 [Saitozyma podzolica]
MPESRQRATFPHTSSSADLTSPEILSPHRAFPPPPPIPTWNNYLTSPPLHPATEVGASSPRRSPSPRPFSLNTLTWPSISTIRFVVLCSLWYTSSAVSSNTGKVILNRFPYPVTLTIVQFFFVAGFCVVCSRKELGWTARLRTPTKAILRNTLPMAVFQVGGHIFSSLAISRVPVSTVHTIKALSPLFTVGAYAALFRVSYSLGTYIALLPLTLGVMLACSFDLTVSNLLGLVCAFGSTLIFVSQNIFFKRVMPTNADTTTHAKLDKINLLYFSSSMALLLMIPLWLYSDARRIFSSPTRIQTGPVVLYFFLNGSVHFAQNLLAFAILSSTSPVTYSIASLVKRIAIICLAIVWFNQVVHPLQAVGIILTAVGLWMYNNAKRDVEKGEKKMRQVEAERDGMLPSTKSDQRVLEGRSKDVHSSPKPLYPSGYVNIPISKSSAIRTAGYQLPSAMQPLSIPTINTAPYPSPPPSVSSSPPNEPSFSTPPAHPASRPVVDGQQRLEPAAHVGVLAA